MLLIKLRGPTVSSFFIYCNTILWLIAEVIRGATTDGAIRGEN